MRHRLAKVLTELARLIADPENFCSRCGKRVEHEDFARYYDGRQGVRSWCKDCERSLRRTKRARPEQRERDRARNRRYRQQQKEQQ